MQVFNGEKDKLDLKRSLKKMHRTIPQGIGPIKINATIKVYPLKVVQVSI